MANHPGKNFRYERKFFLYNIDRVSVEKIILHHPAFFTEIYHERFINNIYFDYINLNNFMDNINGNMYRTKYRIRWYGDMFAEVLKPVLELKIKEGLVGTKDNHRLNKFVLKNGISTSDLKDVVRNSDIAPGVKLAMKEQLPVILNRYRRKYFESADKKFRFTIDDSQSFYKFNSFNNTFIQKYDDMNNVIVELKYNKGHEAEAASVTNKIPFRLTKSSKYVRAVELLYN